uniref:Uncharacterized protein n=1 Tax=Arundo donax TaxID=35708 RepID=A0A0A8YLN9_ARUDO
MHIGQERMHICRSNCQQPHILDHVVLVMKQYFFYFCLVNFCAVLKKHK